MTKVLLDTDKAAVIGAVSGATITDAGTPASDDKVLIQDTSDSDNLKYVNVSDLPGGTVDVVSNVATARIIGRTTAGSGDSEELTAAATRTLLNVEDGATADQDLSALAPIANPTFTGEIGIGSVNVSETELGILEGLTATTAELNILDGVTATTAEINYVDGVTSNVQTQLDAKLTATAYDDATAAEVNTGTSTAKYVSPDSLEGSKYGVRTIVRDVIAHDADQATGTSLGGDFVMPIGGTVIEVGLTVSTAGTTGVGTYDIHKNGTTILSTKITVDSGEKTSRTAATDSVISVAAVAEGDIYTFDIDGVQTTEAKGAQFFIKIRE